MKLVLLSVLIAVCLLCQVCEAKKKRRKLKTPRENECVKRCDKFKNGDYRSCLGCTVYATCSNQYLFDNRPCPGFLRWDDHHRECKNVSSTCVARTTTFCVDDCNGRADGNYQSCNGCTVFATCSNGFIFDNRPCPDETAWDEVTKTCKSTTSCQDV